MRSPQSIGHCSPPNRFLKSPIPPASVPITTPVAPIPMMGPNILNQRRLPASTTSIRDNSQRCASRGVYRFSAGPPRQAAGRHPARRWVFGRDPSLFADRDPVVRPPQSRRRSAMYNSRHALDSAKPRHLACAPLIPPPIPISPRSSRSSRPSPPVHQIRKTADTTHRN